MIHSSQLKWFFSLMIISMTVIGLILCSPVFAQEDEPETAEKSEESATEETATEETGKSEKTEGKPEAKTKVKKKIIPDYMSINKELMTEVELNSLYQELRAANYKLILNRGQSNREAVDNIKKWAKWRMYSLTLKKNKSDLKKLCDAVRKEVGSAGGGLPPGIRPKFRELCSSHILYYAKDLMDGNFYVRLNVAIMIAHLDIEKKTSTNPAVPYSQGGELLYQILENPDQPIPVKLAAAKGLERIGYYGDPIPALKFEIAEALINELQRPGNSKTHPWYQVTLLSALASVDQITDLNGRATILQTLTATMVDPNRAWLVRGTAAKALGRAQKNTKVNIKLLCFEVVKTTHEMAKAFNKNPSAKYWNWSFFRCILAYKTENSEKKIMRRLGFLNQTTTNEYVDASYIQVVKLVKHFNVYETNHKPFPEELLAEVQTWLNENKPVDRSIVPGMAPIVHTSIEKTPDQKTANASVSGKASRSE